MKLIASCKINKTGVYLNSQLISRNDLSESNWITKLYYDSNKEYPKFHKMDNLAKLAFLGFLFLEKKININNYKDDEISLIFSNASSSKTNDLKYINTYTNKGNPSPSLFVYTLPNILTGELAILNKWYGENIFFIQQKFDPKFYIEQIKFYFSKGAKAILAGWVESNDKNEECFLFFIEKKEGKLTIEKLNKLYQNE